MSKFGLSNQQSYNQFGHNNGFTQSINGRDAPYIESISINEFNEIVFFFSDNTCKISNNTIFTGLSQRLMSLNGIDSYGSFKQIDAISLFNDFDIANKNAEISYDGTYLNISVDGLKVMAINMNTIIIENDLTIDDAKGIEFISGTTKPTITQNKLYRQQNKLFFGEEEILTQGPSIQSVNNVRSVESLDNMVNYAHMQKSSHSNLNMSGFNGSLYHILWQNHTPTPKFSMFYEATRDAYSTSHQAHLHMGSSYPDGYILQSGVLTSAHTTLANRLSAVIASRNSWSIIDDDANKFFNQTGLGNYKVYAEYSHDGTNAITKTVLSFNNANIETIELSYTVEAITNISQIYELLTFGVQDATLTKAGENAVDSWTLKQTGAWDRHLSQFEIDNLLNGNAQADNHAIIFHDLKVDALQIGDFAVDTSKLSLISGLNANSNELNILHGALCTTNNLNSIQGLTTSAGYLNKTFVQEGNCEASKCLVVDANRDISNINEITTNHLKIKTDLHCSSLIFDSDTKITTEKVNVNTDFSTGYETDLNKTVNLSFSNANDLGATFSITSSEFVVSTDGCISGYRYQEQWDGSGDRNIIIEIKKNNEVIGSYNQFAGTSQEEGLILSEMDFHVNESVVNGFSILEVSKNDVITLCIKTATNNTRIGATFQNPQIDYCPRIYNTTFNAGDLYINHHDVNKLNITKNDVIINGKTNLVNLHVQDSAVLDCMMKITASIPVSRFYSYYFYSGNGNTSNQYGNASPSLAIDANGYICGWGFMSYSDRRIKENIENLTDNVFDKINQLKPVSFTYIDLSKNSNKTQSGFIAQDVEAVLPNCVENRNSEICDYMRFVKIIGNKLIVDFNILDFSAGMILSLYDDKKRCNKSVMEVNKSKGYILIDSSEGIDVNGDNEVFLYGTNVNDFKQIDYNQFHSLEIKALQQLHKENETLKQRITVLELQTPCETSSNHDFENMLLEFKVLKDEVNLLRTKLLLKGI